MSENYFTVQFVQSYRSPELHLTVKLCEVGVNTEYKGQF